MNNFGWNLPLTDLMLNEESPYAPLDDPAENIAERLVMLAHLSFDPSVWGGHTGRNGRYWSAFGEHLEAATNNATLAAWWSALMRDLPGTPIRLTRLLHEKNLLCRPTRLPATTVPDEAVLMVLRVHTLDLRDRARVWAKVRRETAAAEDAATQAGETA